MTDRKPLKEGPNHGPQVKDKVVTENFRSYLKNARVKWIEKG